MKYVQPYGISDPDAPYINGDPSIARQGSIPPAAAFEHPMRELVAVIENSVMSPDDGDLQQVAKSVRSQRMNYANDTGSINTLSVAFDPPLASYTIGFPIRVKIAQTNTGPSTIDAGAGRVSVRKPNGSEVGAGDLPAAGLADLVFDGTNFQMINFGGAGGGAGSVFQINIPYTVDTGTVNNIIANFSPAITTLVPGTILMVKVINTNTSLTNITVNGLSPKPISAQGGTPEIPLLPTDIMVNDVLILTYDGTRFWMTPNPVINADCSFPVATTSDINLVFKALARKRIQPTVTVTLKMATGIYQGFTTYHIDASRIVIEGTMLAANPTVASFARTGASAAARANDAANNIVMLRGRYGSEIRWTNAGYAGGGPVINVTGPGQIVFKNILIAGDGVQHPQWNGSWVIGGTSFSLQGVSVWGSGGWGVVGSGSPVNASNSFVCNAGGPAWGCGGGTMFLTGCGSFGNIMMGVYPSNNALVFMSGGTSVQCNAGNGIEAILGGMGWIGTYCSITSNGNWDAFASSNASFNCDLSTAVIGSISPAMNTTGNLGAVTVGG